MELKSNTRKFVQMQITPVMAKEMLAANKANRRLDFHAVERYARDMANGNWHMTTDCIGFNKVGQLVNGQHRLSACVKANVSFMSVVAFGLDDTSMAYVDAGKVRSEKDRIAIMHGGVSETPIIYRSNGILAFSKLLYCYLHNECEVRNFTASEVNAIIQEYEVMLTRVYKRFVSKSSGRMVQDRSFIFAMIAAEICGVKEEAVLDFVRFVNKGELVSTEDISTYNVGAAHMFVIKRDKATITPCSRTNSRGVMYNIMKKAYEAENALYCFVNNTKVCRKKTADGEIYPFTKEMLDAFSEEMKAEYSAERV